MQGGKAPTMGPYLPNYTHIYMFEVKRSECYNQLRKLLKTGTFHNAVCLITKLKNLDTAKLGQGKSKNAID